MKLPFVLAALTLPLAAAQTAPTCDTLLAELERRGGRLVPLGYAAAGSVTQLFFRVAIDLQMRYQDWVFE